MFIFYTAIIAISCAALALLTGRLYRRVLPQLLNVVPAPLPAQAMTGFMLGMFLLVLGMNAYIMLGLVVLWGFGLRRDMFGGATGPTFLVIILAGVLAGLSLVVHAPEAVPLGLPLPILMMLVTAVVVVAMFMASPLAQTGGGGALALVLCSASLCVVPLLLPNVSTHVAMEAAVIFAAALVAMRTRAGQCMGYACVWPLSYALAYVAAQALVALGGFYA
jgi:hypothetical protein